MIFMLKWHCCGEIAEGINDMRNGDHENCKDIIRKSAYGIGV